jgi:hypothetical protein
MKSLRFLCPLFIFLGTIALAHTNPVPTIYQPLIPITVKPGSQGFTLTVNGTGFAATAVVSWNGSTRITSFVSSTQLQALINTADVAKPGTAAITVANPGPGGGTSNTVFFPIQTPVPSPVFSRANFTGSGVSVVGDFNNDGIPDLAVGDGNAQTGFFIDIFTGNGDGTFSAPFRNHSVTPITFMVAADFNNDGQLDLAVLDGVGNTTVFLNHKHSIFLQQQVFGSGQDALTTGDFNGDGKVDLLVTGHFGGVGSTLASAVFLGNGDGTFGGPKFLNLTGAGNRNIFGNPAIADFNGDGRLDVALPDSNNILHVLLGNGDGTFQADVGYESQYGGLSAVAADVNGDGKLDVVTDGVSVFQGNGDGTFTLPFGIHVGTGFLAGVNLADFNGDGKLDLVVSNPIRLLLGNGDGTFQNPVTVASENSASLVMGDFNSDGKLDLLGLSLYLQIPINVSPSSLDFGSQKVGTKSPPKPVTVTNTGSSALIISNIGVNGNDPHDFAETNDCPLSLPVAAHCTIQTRFEPKTGGPRSASLNVTYAGLGSPQSVSLSGVGAVVTVTLTPPNLKFSTQLVGTTSPPQTATLINTGSVAVHISNISTTGPFTETNNCPATLPVNGSCQIKVEFAPTVRGPAAGQLAVTDDAQGSPQTVALSGNGTVVKLSATGLNFGNQKVGTKSLPAPVKLTNVGKTALTISQIAIKGADPGDFSQTSNCGNSVPAGGSCTIKVTFTPQAKGQRSGSLQISDNGGGSPQKVALSGNGT